MGKELRKMADDGDIFEPGIQAKIPSIGILRPSGENLASDEGYIPGMVRTTFTMSGGTISGNTAYGGGGVHVGMSGSKSRTFTKQQGGIIYGSGESDSNLNNTARNDFLGHAVYVNGYSSFKTRNTIAGTGVTLDSSLSGSAGGWE
jgi:hypothetical protein